MTSVLCVGTEELLRTATKGAVMCSGLPWVVRLVLPGDITAYARTLYAFAESGQTFVNVEHDIVPAPGQILEIAECPEPWCEFDYDVGGHLAGSGLGCVKFSGAIRAERPWWPQNAFAVHDHGWEWKPWHHLDLAVHYHLTGLGYRPHVHQPPVGHLHTY